MELRLPCGFVDSNGKHVKEVELEEMTGYEEDILVDLAKSKAGVGGSTMNEILARCLKRVGDVRSPEIQGESERSKRIAVFEPLLKNMLIADRSFLFLRLRQASLGDEYAFEVTCPSCKEVNRNMKVNLAELEVVEMGTKSEDMDENGKPVITPSPPKDDNLTVLPSGKKVVWRHLKGEDEPFLLKAQKERGSDLLSFILFRRLKEIDGDKVSGMGQVKGLSSRDRDALRKAIQDSEGGVDTEIEMECSKCNAKFVNQLNVTQKSFFFPSGIR